MSPLALKRAAIALAVVIVLWGGARLLSGARSDEIESLSLPQLTAADVDRIEIQRPADTITLVKDGTAWTANGHPASQSSIDELFTALAEAGDKSELIARSPSSHERMGVDSASGKFFRFFRGDDTVAAFIVGEFASGGGYVRPLGEDNVYRSAAQFPRIATRDLNGWRDRRIAALPVDSITRVDVMRTDGSYTLARADSGQWTIDGEPADSAAVMRVVGSFRDLQAAGFPTPAQEADSVDFTRPYRRITLFKGEGDTALSLVFDSTGLGAWVRPAEGGTVYRLDRWRVDALMPADSTLRASRAE